MEEKRFLTIHDASRLWHIEGAKQVRGIWLIPQ